MTLPAPAQVRIPYPRLPHPTPRPRRTTRSRGASAFPPPNAGCPAPPRTRHRTPIIHTNRSKSACWVTRTLTQQALFDLYRAGNRTSRDGMPGTRRRRETRARHHGHLTGVAVPGYGVVKLISASFLRILEFGLSNSPVGHRTTISTRASDCGM